MGKYKITWEYEPLFVPENKIKEWEENLNEMYDWKSHFVRIIKHQMAEHFPLLMISHYETNGGVAVWWQTDENARIPGQEFGMIARYGWTEEKDEI